MSGVLIPLVRGVWVREVVADVVVEFGVELEELLHFKVDPRVCVVTLCFTFLSGGSGDILVLGVESPSEEGDGEVIMWYLSLGVPLLRPNIFKVYVADK